MRCKLSPTGLLDQRNRNGFVCEVCNRTLFSTYTNPESISRICDPTKPTIIEPKPQPTFGPGTELKKLLNEVGIPDFSGCGCRKKAAQMDEWGVAGCLTNFNVIRDWIVDASKKANWTTKLQAAANATISGLVTKIDPLDIPGSLVRLAIERAKSYDQTV